MEKSIKKKVQKYVKKILVKSGGQESMSTLQVTEVTIRVTLEEDIAC
jgi:hypothetical protein